MDGGGKSRAEMRRRERELGDDDEWAHQNFGQNLFSGESETGQSRDNPSHSCHTRLFTPGEEKCESH